MLLDTIKALENVSKYFYQQKNKMGFDELNKTINKIEMSINEVISMKSNRQINIDEITIINDLSMAMKSLEANDTVLFADILNYEMIPKYEYIINELELAGENCGCL